MESPPVRSFRVPAEAAGQRLDRVLARALAGVSRARVQELIRDGGVRVAGAPAQRPSQLLEAGQRVELREVERSRVRPGGPASAELVVLHEDEHLAFLDKEAGCVAHPSSVVRGGTVSERARARWGELPAVQGADRPGIVHRLDADTTGVMVIAKTLPAAEGLLRTFRERRVRKTYRALVFGAPRFDADWIEVPIGRAPGRSDRMAVGEPGEGRDARTYYETLERFPRFGHVRCRPETGRTHQIRVHLASIGHPLVGDRVYRGRRGLDRHVPVGAPPMARHALHAARLELAHPVTGEELCVEAPLPDDMAAWLAWLRAGAAAG